MQLADAIAVSPVRAVGGVLRVPGDKSISHRYALLSALADGQSTVANYAPGADCASTLACLSMPSGAIVSRASPSRDADPPTIVIQGRGLRGLHRAVRRALDCGNSGSTMRMLSGRAGRASVSRRPSSATPRSPAGRCAASSRRSPAWARRFEAADGDRPPLVDSRRASSPASTFEPEVPSAQVKSAVLLAGLQARGDTRVIEPASTRDHTERALAAFGATVEVSRPRRSRSPAASGSPAGACACPGDLSSAAFFAVAAAALPGSDVTIDDVGLNPTRAALLDVLRRAGAAVEAGRSRTNGRASRSAGSASGTAASTDVVIAPAEVPEVIDELPVLARSPPSAASSRCRGAGELRVKESDRIAALVGGSSRDGRRCRRAARRLSRFAPRGRSRGGTVHAHDDHRLAMAFAIAALGATGPTRSKAPTSSPCRIPPSSTTSGGCAREGRQDLPGRLHGRRARAPSPARSPSVSTGRSRTSTSWIEREERRDIPTHLPAGRRAVLPGPRAGGADRRCCPSAARSSRPAAAPSSIPPNRELMLRDGAVVWLDVAVLDASWTGCPLDGRRPLAADRAARWNSFIISASRPIARRTSASTRDAAPLRSWSIKSSSGYEELMRYLVISDIHANLEAYESVMAAPRNRLATIACSCSAIWSATAPTPTPSSTRSATLGAARPHPRQPRQGRLGRREPGGLQRRGAQRDPLDLRHAVATTTGEWLATLPAGPISVDD